MGDLVIKAAASNSLKIQSDNATNVLTVGTDDSVTLGTEFKVTSTSQTFTVKGIDAAITDSQTGTDPNVADSDSGQLAIYNGSTKLWAISEHGYMLNPTKPYFNVYKDNVTSYTTGGPADIVWNQVKSNVTSSYNTSNGRFTAPISGRYFFAFNILHRGVGFVKGGYAINGTHFYAGSGSMATGSSEFYVDGNVSGSHQHVTIPMILDLSAGDYVTVSVYRSGGDLYFGGNAHNNWIGYLLG